MATNSSFAAAVKDWADRTEQKLETVFQLSFQMTVEAVQDLTPAEPGFLRDSLSVGVGEIATIDPQATGEQGAQAAVPSVPIASARLGDTLTAGFTAADARHAEYGFDGPDSLGRSHRQPGRAMVRLGVQRFPEFVQAAIQKAGD